MAFNPLQPGRRRRRAGVNFRPPYPGDPAARQYTRFYPHNFLYNPNAPLRANPYAPLPPRPRWPLGNPPPPPLTDFWKEQIRLSKPPSRPEMKQLFDDMPPPSHIHYRIRRICEFMDTVFEGLPYFVAGGAIYPLYWFLCFLLGGAIYPFYWFLGYVAGEVIQPFYYFSHDMVEPTGRSSFYWAFRIPLAALLFTWNVHPSYWYIRIPLVLLLLPWEGLKNLDWDKLGWFLENVGWLISTTVGLVLETVILKPLEFFILRPLSEFRVFIRERWQMNNVWALLLAMAIVAVFLHRPLYVERGDDRDMRYMLEHEPKRWAAYATEIRFLRERRENIQYSVFEETTATMYPQ